MAKASKQDAEKQLSALNKELSIQWDDEITGSIWHKGVEYAGSVSLGSFVAISLLRKFQSDDENHTGPRRTLPR